MDDKSLDRAAREVAQLLGDAPGNLTRGMYVVRAALRAIEAAGYDVVPVDQTMEAAAKIAESAEIVGPITHVGNWRTSLHPPNAIAQAIRLASRGDQSVLDAREQF